jgi:hypothetical protein
MLLVFIAIIEPIPTFGLLLLLQCLFILRGCYCYYGASSYCGAMLFYSTSSYLGVDAVIVECEILLSSVAIITVHMVPVPVVPRGCFCKC